MAVTTLDPRSALIVVDLQVSSLSATTIHPMAGVAHLSGRLAASFRQAALPVVLVNVGCVPPGRNELRKTTRRERCADGLRFAPELDQRPTDHVVTKDSWGAFTGTDLKAYLSSHNVTQVVLTGVATSIGVESTARQAYGLGLNVTLAIDAMTDLDAAAHANSLNWIFPRLGETGRTDEILALLQDNSR